MTDKEFRKQKRRVGRILKRWLGPVGFHWHRIGITFNRTDKPESSGCLAECAVSWQYHSAHITFFMTVVEEQNDQKLEHAVVHELSHILAGPLQNYADNDTRAITEHCVESIACALLWARKAGRADVKRKRKSIESAD